MKNDNINNLKYCVLITLSMIGASCKSVRDIMPRRDGDIIKRDNKTLIVPVGTRDTTEIDSIPAFGKYLLTKYINNEVYLEIPYVNGLRHGDGRGFINGKLYATAKYEDNIIKLCKDKSDGQHGNIPLKIYFYDGVFTEHGAINVRDFRYIIGLSDFESDLYATYKVKFDRNIPDDKFRVITNTYKYKLENYVPELRDFIKKSHGIMDKLTQNVYGYSFKDIEIYHNENNKISCVKHFGISRDAVYSYVVNIYNDNRPNEIVFTVNYKDKKTKETKLYFDDNFNILGDDFKPFTGKIIIGKVFMIIENGQQTYSFINWAPGEYSESVYVDGVVHESIRRYRKDNVSYVIRRYSKTQNQK